MNNIYAEADEILRTGNKKAIVSLYLQMQLNFLRAEEAERKLSMAKTEIEKQDNYINQLREALRLMKSWPHETGDSYSRFRI